MNRQPRGRGRAADAPASMRHFSRGLFERFPHGLLLVDGGRHVLGLNGKARELLALEGDRPGQPGWTCCELVCEAIDRQIGLEAGPCVTRGVLEAGEPLPDVQITLGGEGDRRAVSVSASEVDAEDVRVVFELRPETFPESSQRAISRAPGAAGHPQLRVHTLGRFGIELAGEPVEGGWMEERAGLLLKYLICERHGVAASDRIAEALWPSAGPREALTSLRHYVHVLRERLEPGRSTRGDSSFVKTHRGGYRLDAGRVWIDAEELEKRAGEGLRAFAGGQLDAAGAALEAAMSLYAGEFLPDEPDADWVLEERERLHHDAARACAALVDLKLAAEDLDSAAEYSRRLADMEPLDTDVQRRFIEICLRLGRRSDAVRRYGLLRSRTRREFGREPDFTLAELEGA